MATFSENIGHSEEQLLLSERRTANPIMQKITRKNRVAGKTTNILAIKPGSRYLGAAVLQGSELLYWKVKGIKEKGCEKKITRAKRLKRAEEVVASLIDHHQPHVLAIERPFFASSVRSSFLRDLTRRMATLGRKRKLKVRSYLPTQTRRFLCGNGRVTKMEVERIIATEHYPWLFRYYQKDLWKHWWEEKYYYRMFDAVALALYCRHKLGGRIGLTSLAA